ncbi:hypothetical protein F0562_008341 [Nyssa sinensis]|uniref:B box-type domain-containing protein n=1 Tax=Nyssa sinensis TaxID=561372 RepID=A0A5J5A9G6_9ASTE|nr:hypothetical protein F0562_008341 [Nyssa sinensis]
MFCESDQASLCWDCDAEVHSANFLVARHSRSLLCHACQSPTAWSASGSKLGRTVSVCNSCAEGCEGMKDDRGGGEEESQGGNDDEIDAEDDYEGDDDDEDDDDDDELSGDDEDGDNQVVPWSSTPPPAANLHSEDDLGCSSSQRDNSTPSEAVAARPTGGGEATFVDSLMRPLKTRRTEPNSSSIVRCEPAGPRSASIVESLKRFHQQDMTSGNNASAAIADICKLSNNPAAVDFDSFEYS